MPPRDIEPTSITTTTTTSSSSSSYNNLNDTKIVNGGSSSSSKNQSGEVLVSSSSSSDHDQPSSTKTNNNNSSNSNRNTKYPYDHNTPSNTGFFRNTFHYEMNIITMSIAIYIYYQCMIQTYSIILVHIAHAILLCILFDMTRYYYYKGTTCGTPYTLPFVNIITMLFFPVRYWAELGTIAMESGYGMCTSMMANTFMIFVTDHNLCREIMTSEGMYGIFAHPNALWLFGSKNLIYMNTSEHKQFRSILTPALFSKDALQQYAMAQESICRQYLHQYVIQCQITQQPIDIRVAFRSMAAASSQEAFLGPYLTDTIRKQLEQDIVTFTMGFLSFPIPYIGGLRRAIQAKNRIEAIIASMIPLSYEYIIPKQEQPSSEQSEQQQQQPPTTIKNEPRCLLDRWCLAIYEESITKHISIQDVPYCDHENMARTVLDFLFAAQDATNSALTFCLDVLDDHPIVLQNIQQEIDTICPRQQQQQSLSSSSSVAVSQKNGNNDNNNNDQNNMMIPTIWSKMNYSSSTDTSSSSSLPYIAKVANQLLHHKPPVPMIPHIAKQSTTLGNVYVPKGTIVIPSITYSARTSGASTYFQVDDDIQNSYVTDPLFVKTVVFGAGQHKCPGRRYAESLLNVFIAVLVQNYTFTRYNPHRPTMDEFVYYPTTFPKDNYFMIYDRPL